VFLGFPFGGGGVPSSTTTTFGLSLNLSWELDLWGRLRAGHSAALADVQAEAADFVGAQQSLIAQTSKSYFALVEARQQLALSEATVAAFAATAEDVRDRFRRGVRPALDTYQAESSLGSAQANLAQQHQRVTAAARQLEVLMGRYPAAAQASTSVLSATLPEVPVGLPSELLGRRPDLAAAERRLAAAGCRVDAARAALYPRISLTASGGTNSEKLGDVIDDALRVWTLGANLLQPLFRGGALRADVARNQALRLQAVAGYGGTLLRAFEEVENALSADEWLAARELAASRAASTAASARDLARERYQLGLTDFLAVLDGQQRAFAAESLRIAIARQRLDNRIDLILALGGGFRATPPDVRDATTSQATP
jgi:outer membrane protein, multidrug efflux system